VAEVLPGSAAASSINRGLLLAARRAYSSHRALPAAAASRRLPLQRSACGG
jgi:hypothetical protein